MSAFHDNALIGASGQQGYKISRSVRLRSSASAYLQRTNATTGTDPLKFTVSGWVKRGLSTAAYFPLLGSDTGSNAFVFIGFQGDNLAFRIRTSAPVDVVRIESSAVYRDFSAWYHIVAVYDSANATSTERVKLYVNGLQLTAFGTATYPSLNQAPTGDFLTDMQIGRTNTNNVNQNYGDGYLTEINFIDGQALTPAAFGETDAVTGVWQPKKYAGTYGNNGYYLNFSDPSAATAAAIGKDYSGNGNNWTPNNISVTAGVTYDSMLDVPTLYADGGNGRGNYCTLNPVAPNPSTTASTCADGNLTASASAANTMRKATVGITSGAYYFEATLGSTVQGFGLGEAAVNSFGTNSASTGARTYYLYNGGANLYTILPSADTSITTTVGSGGTLAVAVDMTNKKLWLGYAASGGGSIIWIGGGSPSAGTSPTHTFASDVSEVFPLALTNGPALYCNFGQRPFTYTPPTGFVALNTQNLPDATIKKGNQYFDATTYTGTGASLAVVNSGAFQPDLVWTKSRSNTYSNHLEDAVRGVGLRLLSDSTAVEVTGVNGKLTSFNSNGFTQDGGVEVGASAGTYVAWQWNAGGSTVTNTSGSITSSVRANPTAGFSVVTYTGTGANATVGHGLGVAPSMIIVKNRSGVDNWWVYSSKLPITQYLQLNLTAAANTSTTLWNSTSPTSSVFSLGVNNANTNAATYVAYLFAEVAGFSKFGSYTGNGSADGPFVFCGFRPKYVLIKRTDAAGNWNDFDTSRNPYNGMNNLILLNSSAAESVGGVVLDSVSNGFKLRDASANWNASGGTYIFAAFAENPFKNSLAR